MNDAGGWKDRTTVEDMDLAIRANLRGWKFLYVGDLEVSCLLALTTTKFIYGNALKSYYQRDNVVHLGAK